MDEEMKSNNSEEYSDDGIISTRKYKNFHIAIGIFFVLLSIIPLSIFLISRKQKKIDISVNNQTHIPTSIPTPSYPVIHVNWHINLFDKQVFAPNSLLEKNLVYAIKDGYHITVLKQDISDPSKQASEIFSYDDSLKADATSENYWEGSPPSIALSPDKKFIAFIDNQGLKQYSLITSAMQNLITKTTIPASDSATPPQWSQQLNQVYAISLPSYSYDSRYISFVQDLYEGSTYGLLDLQTNTYSPIAIGGYDAQDFLHWDPFFYIFINPQLLGVQDPGLFIGSASDSAKTENLANSFHKGNNQFLSAVFSNDGKKIAFTYVKSNTEIINNHFPNDSLAIINIDGTGFKDLISQGNISSPFFSPDDNAVYFIEESSNGLVLSNIDINSDIVTRIALLPDGVTEWRNLGLTKEGYIILQGKYDYYNSSTYLFTYRPGKLLIIDANKKKVIYYKSDVDLFTRFAGFLP